MDSFIPGLRMIITWGTRVAEEEVDAETGMCQPSLILTMGDTNEILKIQGCVSFSKDSHVDWEG
jgi:hypothetical protein